MYISDYQIQNVLKVYSKQLTRNKTKSVGSENGMEETPKADKINLSAEGKRRAIVDKVAADIVNRIMQFGPREAVDHEVVSQLNDEMRRDVDINDDKEKSFVFNVIDGNEKKTSTLEVDDSRFLVNRLEQLAKKVVHQGMKS